MNETFIVVVSVIYVFVSVAVMLYLNDVAIRALNNWADCVHDTTERIRVADRKLVAANGTIAQANEQRVIAGVDLETLSGVTADRDALRAATDELQTNLTAAVEARDRLQESYNYGLTYQAEEEAKFIAKIQDLIVKVEHRELAVLQFQIQVDTLTAERDDALESVRLFIVKRHPALAELLRN